MVIWTRINFVQKVDFLLKRYSSINKCSLKRPLYSLRTMRHAFVQLSLKKMQYCFIRKKYQAGPPPPENRKWGLTPLENNTLKNKKIGTLSWTPTSKEPGLFVTGTFSGSPLVKPEGGITRLVKLHRKKMVWDMQWHAVTCFENHSFQVSHRALTPTNLWQRFPHKVLLA